MRIFFLFIDAVEYSIHSPTDHLKPIDEKDIPNMFTHCTGELPDSVNKDIDAVDDEEDAETAANSRILQDWENIFDLSNDQYVPKSHRRRNNKNKKRYM